MGSELGMHMCTYVCTSAEQSMEQNDLWLRHMAYTYGHRGGYTFVLNYVKGVGETWDKYSCVHVLVHVYLLFKVWDHMREGGK